MVTIAWFKTGGAMSNLAGPVAAATLSLVGIEALSEILAGESFQGEMLYLPFVRLGGLHLGNVPVIYADVHVFDIWDLKTTPALVLGMDMLTQFETVSLDFGRSRVRFDIADEQSLRARKS